MPEAGMPASLAQTGRVKPEVIDKAVERVTGSWLGWTMTWWRADKITGAVTTVDPMAMLQEVPQGQQPEQIEQ